jgi:hypothetical protein
MPETLEKKKQQKIGGFEMERVTILFHCKDVASSRLNIS